ncbi:MAG: cytochrome c oxidase subunit 3 [Wenzhouxiangellaceae bacterium]|nr:cytochrome c oxidase subunit 3 [Wenzhouxiangellaceae bacterium]
MTITLIAIVLMLAVFLGWIVSHTINVRPWSPEAGDQAGRDRLPAPFTVPRAGLIVFLAAITSLFALTISAYSGRMQMANDWQSVSLPDILWFNSAMLVGASIAFHAAWRAIASGRLAGARLGLAAGGAASIVFLFGQWLAWRALAGAGVIPGGDPAAAFFYFLTGLHGVHVIGGLVAWARAMTRLVRRSDLAEVRVSVELCTIYWHYLLAIWAILFALLLAT